MTTLIDSVASFGISRLGAALSDDERQVALELITDSVTCELSGRGGEAHALSQRFTSESGECSARDHALAAGVALRDLDLLDVFVGRDVCHPAENIPIVLRLASAVGCDGATTLRAIAVAYEAQCRFADVVDVRKGGFHHVSAAAIAIPLAALHLGLVSAERVRDALALSIARGPSLRSIARGHVSTAKAFAYPLAARAAMEAVDLAEVGVTGPQQALDDLVALTGFAPEDVIDAFRTEPLRSRTLARVRIKRFPVQFSLQAVGHAGLLLHAMIDSRAESIIRVEVQAGSRLLDNTIDVDKRDPVNRETADHSLFATLAIALVEGALGPEQLIGEAWKSKMAHRIMRLIEVGPFPSEEEQGAEEGMMVRCRIVLEGGEEHVVNVAPSEGFVPIGGDGEPVRAKLREVLSTVPQERVEALTAAISALPGADSPAGLVRILDAWPQEPA